jgi:hypothetical protein
MPPVTEAQSALALFQAPPPTDAHLPLDVFSAPPLTDAKSPLATLRKPPLTARPYASGGGMHESGAGPGPAMLHTPPLTAAPAVEIVLFRPATKPPKLVYECSSPTTRLCEPARSWEPEFPLYPTIRLPRPLIGPSVLPLPLRMLTLQPSK